MDNALNTSPGEYHHHHAEEAVKLLLRGLIPLFLMIGGIVLLFLRLPGWGVILGLPMLVIGGAFLIYTYDEVLQNKIEPVRGRITMCAVCGKATPLVPGVDKHQTVCARCQEEGR